MVYNRLNIPCIPDEEYKQRVEKVQQAMAAEGYDLILCYGNEAEPQFVRYFSTTGHPLKRQVS